MSRTSRIHPRLLALVAGGAALGGSIAAAQPVVDLDEGVPVAPAPVPAAPDEPPPPRAPAPALEQPAPVVGDEPPPPAADDAPAIAPRIRSGVRGRIVDADTGEPVAGVIVEVEGQGDRAATDRDGRFHLELAPGDYTLRVTGELYRRHRIRNVVVRRGVTTVDVRLAGEEIEEVVVIAPPDTASDAVQVVRRRKRATVSDAISAEQISRSPDSSASDAAKRMVGATIQDGRYVVIRGLGGRYSLTLLNGVTLPSPDPDVPAAPLDLFPAAMLANLTVTKTFSPDMPGNFAGGALSIETRSFPSKFTLRVRMGTSYDSQTTFGALNRYPGGAYDVLGFDDGTRALPSAIPTDRVAAGPELGDDEFQRQLTSFRNAWAIEPAAAGPNGGFGVTVGDTVALDRGKQQLGYFATAAYGRSYSRRVTRIAAVGEPDGEGGFLPSVLQLQDAQGTASATLSGLLTAGWMPSQAHNVNLIALYTHSGEDLASLVTGVDNNTTVVERTRLRFQERQMVFTQLVGESGLARGKAILGWQANVARVSQYQPDTRDLMRAEVPDGRYVIGRGSGAADRLFADLGDTSGGGGLDVTIPLEGVKLKAGGSVLHSERTYQARRFHFDVYGETAFEEPHVAFSDETAGRRSFYEATTPSDGYAATRNVSAGYVMVDVSRWEPLRIVGGVRVERAALDLGLSSAIDLDAPAMELTRRVDRGVLPAVNAVYGVTKTTNLRAAYGLTVARPNFREVAPALYYDYVRRRAIGGNPNLLETQVHNADLRWETFLGDTELVAASVFYKRFRDPIERTVEDASSGSNVGFANAPGATSYGIELEARIGLGRIHAALAELSLGANLALIGSAIDLAGGAERPLQGQSPYVANVDLGWSNAKLGLQANLLFNSFGARIEEVGTGGAGNILEEPFHRLDLTIGKSLPRDLKLKLAGTNLLGQRVVRTQNGVEILAYPVGIGVAASLELGID